MSMRSCPVSFHEDGLISFEFITTDTGIELVVSVASFFYMFFRASSVLR